MAWKEGRESLNQFVHRVREAALALPEPVSDDTMLDRFIQSLPPTVQDLAISVPGSFDEVSGRVAMISASTALETGRGRYRGERVRQLQEEGGQQKSSAARAEPGPQPIPLPTVEDRFASAMCYYCSQKGHIARYCEKKRRDRAEPAGSATAQGEGKGGGRRPGELRPRRN